VITLVLVLRHSVENCSIFHLSLLTPWCGPVLFRHNTSAVKLWIKYLWSWTTRMEMDYNLKKKQTKIKQTNKQQNSWANILKSYRWKTYHQLLWLVLLDRNLQGHSISSSKPRSGFFFSDLRSDCGSYCIWKKNPLLANQTIFHRLSKLLNANASLRIVCFSLSVFLQISPQWQLQKITEVMKQ